ncbi:MAG TPA: oligoendopeptidase F [Roseiflexaceae bacterium]|nr:oligoendopeptidase F [Roseiflexaceae bacterium]
MTTLARRADVEREHTWDLEAIFPNLEQWEQRFAAVERDLPNLARFQGHLGDSPAALREWLTESERIVQLASKLFVYARLQFDQDTTNQEHAALNGRAQGLMARVAAATAFAEPELLALGQERIKELLAGDPELAVYAHAFDDLLRLGAHVRSGEVEALLAEVSEPLGTPRNAYTALADGDLTFEPAPDADGATFPVARGTIANLLDSDDRTLRRNAWRSYADGFLSVKNTMAALLVGSVRSNVFMARTRGYPSALEASLAENNVPLQVFENVIDACNRHLPLWHRYWDIRRRALGLERLEGCDVFAPLTNESVDVPYQQSVEWISAGMKPLGDDYVEIMRRGMTEERWVDIYPNVGKRGGAYSSGTYGTHPYILMSYTGGLKSMSTLAHELGHSLHSYFSRRDQPFVYSRYTLFVAEVASNFNQALVRAHLLNERDDRAFQIGLIEEAMGNFHRYLFVMPILAQFERHIHAQVEQGQAPTADSMTRHLAELLRAGYGPAVQVDEMRDGIDWATFPHMYMNFYVYQYASGIAAANALAAPIAAGDADAVARYRKFLSSGGSLYPLEALQVAGIDMATPEPMDRAFNVMEGFVDRLDELV